MTSIVYGSYLVTGEIIILGSIEISIQERQLKVQDHIENNLKSTLQVILKFQQTFASLHELHVCRLLLQ